MQLAENVVFLQNAMLLHAQRWQPNRIHFILKKGLKTSVSNLLGSGETTSGILQHSPGTPLYRTDVRVERSWQRTTELAQEQEHLTVEDRPKALGLCSLVRSILKPCIHLHILKCRSLIILRHSKVSCTRCYTAVSIR